jgi:hypothetical protein
MMREYRLRKKASKLVAEKSRGLPIERPVPTFERDGMLHYEHMDDSMGMS